MAFFLININNIMTNEEFLAKIREFYKESSDETICRDIEEGLGAYSNVDEEKFTEELGEYKEVYAHGGEGEGSDYWQVYYFPKVDKYLKLSGWYESYHGREWTDIYVVSPKQKTITVYE
jgi:hypothetical protein